MLEPMESCNMVKTLKAQPDIYSTAMVRVVVMVLGEQFAVEMGTSAMPSPDVNAHCMCAEQLHLSMLSLTI